MMVTISKKLFPLVLAAAAMLAAACSGDETIAEAQTQRTAIGFGIDFPRDVSRAAMLETAGAIPADWVMHVSCHSSKPGEEGGYYFRDIPFSLADGRYASQQAYYWQCKGETCRFIAFLCGEGDLTPDTGSEQPTVRHSVPSDATDHRDLLYSRAERPDDFNVTLPFTMRHALTAIRFRATDDCDDVTIHSIAVQGVATTGSFATTGDWGTAWSGAWSALSGTAQTTVCTLSPAVQIAGTDRRITPDGEATFMMIPQTIPAGARVMVTFSFEGEATRRNVAAPLDGQWPIGKTLTYKLKIEPQKLTIEVEPWNMTDIGPGDRDIFDPEDWDGNDMDPHDKDSFDPEDWDGNDMNPHDKDSFDTEDWEPETIGHGDEDNIDAGEWQMEEI